VGAQSCRVVIPTRDGSRWLPAFARAYARLGIHPLYILDGRTVDDSRAVLAKLGCDVVEVPAEHDRGEDVLWRGAGAARAEWLLRMDDDEMPSRCLIDWIAEAGVQRPEPVLYVSCRQYWAGGYSRMESFYFNHSRPDFLAPQPRLFRPDRVRFTDALHTAGIETDGAGWAPAAAFFLHLDWVVRDRPARLAKLVGYERQRPGGGIRYAHFSLPEHQDYDRLRITALPTREFAPLLSDVRTGLR